MAKSIVFRADNYYEAIIQLRPYDEEIFDYIEAEMKKRKEAVFVTRIEEQKTGIDIYLTSQKFARTLGPKMKKRFRGWELKMTRKIHTRDKQRSRDVYRATILFKKLQKKDE